MAAGANRIRSFSALDALFKPKHKIDELINNLQINNQKFNEYNINSVDNVIDVIDENMNRYYELRGRDHYKTDQNRQQYGIFKLWCEEQNFDDNMVKDELEEEPVLCALTEFCGDYNEFPFETDEFKTNVEQQIEIHRIINLCINSMYSFDKQLFYCWITPNCIVNTVEFKFKFNLWILYKKKYYRYEIEINYEEIKKIYEKNKNHFADKRIKPTTKRTQQWKNKLFQKRLNYFIQKHKNAQNDNQKDDQKCNTNQQNTFSNDNWYLSQTKYANMIGVPVIQYLDHKVKQQQKRMKFMMKYTMYNPNDLGKGRGKISFWGPPRHATVNDLEDATHVLRKLLNNPSLVLSSDFFDNFIFKGRDNREIRLLIKTLAYEWLTHIRYRAQYDQNDQKILWDLKNSHTNILSNKELSELEFHRVEVVKKQGKYLHWALKFESFNKLLSLDWFNNSRIRIQLLDNNVIGKKIYWYGETSGIDDVTYTKRWETIHRQNLDPIISGKQIGLWIKIWITLYPEYNILKNSCQHFVRDIMSAIDIKAADRLTKCLNRSIISNLLFPDNVAEKEEKRTKKISDQLKLYVYLEKCQLNCYQYFDVLKNLPLDRLQNIPKHSLIKRCFKPGHAKKYVSNIDYLV